MKLNRKNAGFTLIELMIVVAIIAIIASVAIPKLMAARLSANESAAISTLRSLSSAQAQLQSSSAIDSDADGGGEYAYFGELSGTDPMRVSVNAGGVITQAIGTVANGDVLSPAVMSSAFGNVVASIVTRSGYNFAIFLPGATAGGVVPGIAEAAGGGSGAGALIPNPNNCEIFWCAYAWPTTVNQSGNRTFFINQEGDLLQNLNRNGLYTGAAGPGFADAYSVAGDMSSALGVNAIAANVGTWTVLQ